MKSEVRRIVTCQGRNGRSFIASMGPVPYPTVLPEGSRYTEVWITNATPYELTPEFDEPTRPTLSIDPPPGGSAIRVVDVAPASKVELSREVEDDFLDKLGGNPTLIDQGDPRGPMHRTETIDYIVMISGELTLVLQDDEVKLRVGDVVVQRGCNHLWHNHTEEFARVAFIMIDARYPDASTDGS